MIHFEIGCSNGKTYVSDSVSHEELNADIEKNNGIIGQDPKNGLPVRVKDSHEALEFMIQFFKYDSSSDTQTVTLLIDGVPLTFNSIQIVWYRLVDGDS